MSLAYWYYWYAPFYGVVGFVYWFYYVWCSRFRQQLHGGSIRGPLVIVANHPSEADPLRISLYLRTTLGFAPVHWFAKHELVKHEWLRRYYVPRWPWIVGTILARFAVLVIRGYGVIPVLREKSTSSTNRQALECAEWTLKHGGIVGIFSEGGTNPSIEDDTRVSTSAVWLASKLNVPILPVSVTRQRRVVVGGFITLGQLQPKEMHTQARSIMCQIWRRARAA